MKLPFLPTGSPDTNPVEECWRQFKRALDNRYFGKITGLRFAVWDVIETIYPPELIEYLCHSV